MDQDTINNREKALQHCWRQFKLFDENSINLKKTLVKWRKTVLFLTIFGAVAGTISSQLEGVQPELLGKILGGIGAGAVALAAYFSKNLLGQNNELSWVSARSIAEAIKSEIYLFACHAKPYDQPSPEKLLLKNVSEISEKLTDYTLEPIPKDLELDGIIKTDLTTSEYIEERVNDQANWLKRKALTYQGYLKNANKTMIWLGAITVILGVLMTYHTSFGAWVAVISTISATIAAYVFSERFSYLAISYQATSTQLERFVVEWDISKKLPADNGNLVIGCERTLSIENKAWMAELSKKNEDGEVAAD